MSPFTAREVRRDDLRTTRFERGALPAGNSSFLSVAPRLAACYGEPEWHAPES